MTDHITLSYDALGRVTSRTVTVNNTPVHALTLTYDAAGRIATRTDTGSGTRTYSYDSDSRLTTVSGAETSAYTYDTRDNLTSSPAGTTTYTADDRVASSTYDPNGRLAGRGPDSFTYSPRGELLSATVGGVTATYTYDSAARRVTRTAAGVTTQYLYGSLDDPTQLTASRTAATGLSIYRYDAAGMLIAIERGTNRYLVATDPVGSPIAAYDTVTTAIVLQRSYDAYGRLTTTSGTLDLPIGYAGGLTDPTTGLTRFGQRDYDPDTGRFTAPDPILYGGGQLNLYTYVNANPISHTDPLGLADGGQSRQPAPKVCRNDETSIRRELNEWDRLLQANGRTGKTDDATVKRGHDIESTMHRLTDHVPLLGDGKPISSHALASSGAATRS